MGGSRQNKVKYVFWNLLHYYYSNWDKEWKESKIFIEINFLIELEILRFPSGDADNSLKHRKKNHTTSKVRYSVLDKYENLYNLINGID